MEETILTKGKKTYQTKTLKDDIINLLFIF